MRLRYKRSVVAAVVCALVLQLGLLILFGLTARPCLAAPGVLVLVRSVGSIDPAPYELRLRSELQTEGIDAVVINASASNQDAKPLASRFGANGVIEVNLADDEATAWVWVVEPTISLEISRSIRVNLSQRDAVAVFALRSVDLLVGAKLELEQQRRARQSNAGPSEGATLTNGAEPTTTSGAQSVSATQKTKASDKSAASGDNDKDGRKTKDSGHLAESLPMGSTATSASRPSRFRLGAGISMVQFTDHLGRRIAPSLAGSVWFSEHWGIGLTLAAPYIATILMSSTAASGVSESNRITIDQEFVWVDGRYRKSISEQFDFESSIGLGLARYGAKGSGGATYVGRSRSAASVVSSLGASLAWRVSPKVRLMADVACLVRWQTPLVMVDGNNETGTSGLNFWGSFGPAWVF